jgi:hypothetical protein
MDKLTVIGHTEYIDLPKHGILKVPAKIDTGADSSSIWASDVRVEEGALKFKLFNPGSEFHTGKDIVSHGKQFQEVTIINSFGHKEKRYKVKLSITLRGRNIRATMTLANRENTTYPVLLGRRLLANKFLVDVSRQVVNLKQVESKT